MRKRFGSARQKLTRTQASNAPKQTRLAHIQKDARQVLIEHKNAVRHFQTVILSKNPATILGQGYAMIKKDNVIIKSVNGVKSGDELTVIFWGRASVSKGDLD